MREQAADMAAGVLEVRNYSMLLLPCQSARLALLLLLPLCHA
jgi:hypothetical protein